MKFLLTSHSFNLIFKEVRTLSHFSTFNIETYLPNLDEYDKKIDLMYLKGILSDKMLVFDDANLKIGCIRSVSTEWRQATLKLYLGNKNASSQVKNIVFSKDI